MGKAKIQRSAKVIDAKVEGAPWWRAVLIGVGLIVMTMVAYGPIYGAGFIWDDDDYVTQNRNVSGDGDLAEIWFSPRSSPQYYPMVFTTFRVEHGMWGLSARGYHTTNVLLHGVSAVLLWRLLRALKVPGALLAAGIFAVHPVMVESVGWITERKNVLSMVFYLSAMHVYLRWSGAIAGRGGRESEKPHWGGYALAIGLFVLALLSKSVTASLPAAVLVIFWWQGRLNWRAVWPLVPFFVLGILAGAHTGYLERTQVGAIGAEWDYSFGQRVLMAGRAIWFYAGKLVWPVELTFIYPKWRLDAGAGWQWMFPVGVMLVVGVLFALRKKIGRGPLAAVLFFIGTLVPALGFVNIYPMRYSLVADHFQYHASVGLIVLLAGVGTLLARRLGVAGNAGRAGQAERLKGGMVVAGVICAVLLRMTFLQCYVYQSRETLWRDVVAKNDGGWLGHLQLGHLATERRPADFVEAEREYRRANELAPEVSEPYFNLGLIAMERKEWDRAEELMRVAVRNNPTYVEAYNSAGLAMKSAKQRAMAIEWFKQAVSAGRVKGPGALFKPLYNLGTTLVEARDFKGALPYLIEAAEINPNHEGLWNWIGKVGMELGDERLVVEAKRNLARLRGR